MPNEKYKTTRMCMFTLHRARDHEASAQSSETSARTRVTPFAPKSLKREKMETARRPDRYIRYKQ